MLVREGMTSDGRTRVADRTEILMWGRKALLGRDCITRFMAGCLGAFLVLLKVT